MELNKLLSDSVATTLYELNFVERSVLRIYDIDSPIGPTMATLVGSKTETPTLQKDMKVHIAAIDGRSTMLKTSQFARPIAVPPGRHSVRIYAEQLPRADGLATVSATFEPGKRYVLRASRIGTAATVQELIFDCCSGPSTPIAWVEEDGTGNTVSERAPLSVRYAPPMVLPVVVK